jgi:hypothetical protein
MVEETLKDTGRNAIIPRRQRHDWRDVTRLDPLLQCPQMNAKEPSSLPSPVMALYLLHHFLRASRDKKIKKKTPPGPATKSISA